MNYAEQYPQCAGCPRLNGLQGARDKMTSDFERASVKHMLDTTAETVKKDSEISSISTRYAEFLDAVNDGTILADDPRIAEAHRLYVAQEEELARITPNAKKMDSTISDISHTLGRFIDMEADILTDRCTGKKTRRLMALTGVLGRSGCKSLLPASMQINFSGSVRPNDQ